ncbi:S49 family peptidase [Salinicola sp. JS01]|uniref:S49 family peptidase n=1 Tax=Salinicola sp. JS01 TaxID=3050071 RepID=UPI00255BCA0C|nr:S49 family peptidase [Salinicola sp. JS01]WIX32511.1 S49 family peptidase [Salinicola sp. JS01]
MSQLINYPHLASLVFNTPLYATPDLMQTVRAVLEPRLLGRLTDMPERLDAGGSPESREMQSLRVVGRLAIIPVHGILTARAGQIDGACQEILSYEKLRGQIHAALRHEMVEEIVLDMHSGGGAAMGCKELADFIRVSTEIKPITALINFAAFSACYMLAAACSRIVCSPTAMAGSIGVIIETYEVSKAEEAFGIKFNTYYRGAHKNDCSPHEPITDQAVAEIDRRLDAAYATFTESVADHRGIDLSVVTGTEARMFDAEGARAIKLIDEIAPAQEALDSIAARYSGQQAPRRGSVSARAGAMKLQNTL